MDTDSGRSAGKTRRFDFPSPAPTPPPRDQPNAFDRQTRRRRTDTREAASV